MTGTELPPYPEEKGSPLLSAAVQSILIDQFKDELEFGKPSEREPGTDPAFQACYDIAHDEAIEAAREQRLTWTHLLIAQVYESVIQEDPAEFRIALTSLGATVVQAIESLDTCYAGV